MLQRFRQYLETRAVAASGPRLPWMAYTTTGDDRVYNVKINKHYIEAVSCEDALLQLDAYIASEGGPSYLEETMKALPQAGDHEEQYFASLVALCFQNYTRPITLRSLSMKVMHWKPFVSICLGMLFSGPSVTQSCTELLDNPEYAYFAYHSLDPDNRFITEAVTDIARARAVRPSTMLHDLIECIYRFPDNVLCFQDDLRSAIQFLLSQTPMSTMTLLTRLPYLRLYYGGGEPTIRHYVPICKVMAFVIDACWPYLDPQQRVQLMDASGAVNAPSMYWNDIQLPPDYGRAEYSRAAWSYIRYLSGGLKEGVDLWAADALVKLCKVE